MRAREVETVDMTNVFEARVTERLLDAAEIALHLLAGSRLRLWRLGVLLISDVEVGANLLELFLGLLYLLDVSIKRRERPV